ncbi:MAG: site-specific DNA-methyltransferase [Desulfurellaceae bacterium]|nr:site-specific DNA-methyltransferase [Desulfurellaceae bacterium]
MPRARKNATRDIESYAHPDKERVNNPPVGLVTPDTDKDAGKKTYAYDPHLDPQLQWAGKAEHTSFEVPTVSLHVHERIDPRSIIETVRKQGSEPQLSLFATPQENPPIRQAIEFYKHRHNWTNRLIAGDSLLVMNSLLEKEGMAGKVQMVYIDPPYGIRYGSNFQPFVNKRDVTDGRDEDLTQEPETIRAFRDTWELGIHSYLAYLRDRLLLARELLTESGSCFVQISDENLHHVRELMDEVFGVDSFVSIISVRKTTSQGTASLLGTTTDFIVWYARARNSVKYHQIFIPRSDVADERYDQALLPDGSVVSSSTLTESQENLARLFQLGDLTSSRPAGEGDVRRFEFRSGTYTPGKGTFKTHRDGLTRLAHAERLQVTTGSTLRYRRFKDDFPIAAIGNLWHDISGAVQSRSDPKVYVVQSSTEIIARCILMTTDPGDLVFDPTCGSGTTAFVAEQWGRRWITCDTSRVAVTLAKQRLMTANFDYYALAHPNEGVGSGFQYKTVPHITLGSIANNPDIKEGMTSDQIDAAIARHAPQETLYDQPLRDTKKARVTGPFTVEAVPAPAVKAVDEVVDLTPTLSEKVSAGADESVARSGETLRQGDWRDELLKTGIRGKAGQRISFVRLEPLPATRWLHAEGETRPDAAGAERVREEGTAWNPERVVVSFGPDHAPLEQRQVEHAWEEARTLRPQPKLLVFAAFQFDPEAAKDIDELKPELTGMQFLKVQMNADLLTDDLKKKRASNESFWLIGQPDVELEKITEGDDQGKCRVSVLGFDYYNTKTGGVESGGADKIAMWLLDPDYDGRSLFPRQVFFPMADAKDGWAKLARNLKAEIDEDLIEAYRGTVSLPFAAGEHRRIAVKIIDDRGIESLKIVEIE